MVTSRYSKSLLLRRIHGSQGTRQGIPRGDHSLAAGRPIPDREIGGAVVREVWSGLESGLAGIAALSTRTRIKRRRQATMPYRCRDCKRYFSVKTGTLMVVVASSPSASGFTLIYLDVTSLKGVVHRRAQRELRSRADLRSAADRSVDLLRAQAVCGGVDEAAPRPRRHWQKTAWFMQQRIREAFRAEGPMVFAGPVEVDETYFGGREKNKHASKKLRAGRGTVGKTAVVGAKDRATNQVAARVVDATDKKTLQGFVKTHAARGAKVYTDDASAYDGLENREAVRHSVARVRQGPSAHERGGELLEHAQAGAQGHVPQAEREAPAALRERVRGPSQHPRDGHDPANGARRGRHGRASAYVSGPNRLARRNSGDCGTTASAALFLSTKMGEMP